MLIKDAICENWPSVKFVLKTISQLPAGNCHYPWPVMAFDKDGLALAR